MRTAVQAALAGTLLTATLAAQAMPVQGLTAEATGQDSVRLRWNAADGAASYDLYQGGARIASGLTSTDAVVRNLQPQTGYDFFVTACDAALVCSAPSATANTTITAGANESSLGSCPAATDGSAPRVAITPSGDGTATLAWCRVEGAAGCNVFLDGLYADTLVGDVFSTRLDYRKPTLP